MGVSNECIGAVLSQRSVQDNRIHPCAYPSHKLTSDERNYDVGNKELDAFSHLYDAEHVAKEPNCGAVSWQIESYLEQSIVGSPAPSGCLHNRLSLCHYTPR